MVGCGCSRTPTLPFAQKSQEQPPSLRPGSAAVINRQRRERSPAPRGSTWSVPGTTSKMLSWLRVSRMYRSFSGHISGHVPTKVLALSRSVLFTRAERRQVKVRPYQSLGRQRARLHNETGKKKHHTQTSEEQREFFKNLALEKGKHSLAAGGGHQGHRDPPGLSPSGVSSGLSQLAEGHMWEFMPRRRTSRITIVLQYVC